MFLFAYNKHNLIALDENVLKVIKPYFYCIYVL
jgi:hypothetical protein